MSCVGACNVLPLNTMIEAAPQLHGYVNSCQWTVSNLPLRGSEGHLNLCAHTNTVDRLRVVTK